MRRCERGDSSSIIQNRRPAGYCRLKAPKKACIQKMRQFVIALSCALVVGVPSDLAAAEATPRSNMGTSVASAHADTLSPSNQSQLSTLVVEATVHGTNSVPLEEVDESTEGVVQASTVKIASAEQTRSAKASSLERAKIALAQSPAAPPQSMDDLCDMLVDAAHANELPLAFFANLIWQESHFDSMAISPVGAMGIAQFMPDVADELSLDAFDVSAALPASAHLLAVLFRRFGNLGLAAAAYNAGPRHVSNWLAKRGGLPSETRNYVRDITGQAVELWRGATAQTTALQMPVRLPCQRSAVFAAAEQTERQGAEADAMEDDRIATVRVRATRHRASWGRAKHRREKQRVAERNNDSRHDRRRSNRRA